LNDPKEIGWRTFIVNILLSEKARKLVELEKMALIEMIIQIENLSENIENYPRIRLEDFIRKLV
jgi:hypothetical protein